MPARIAAFIDRVHPDDRATVLETFANAAKSGVDFCFDHRSMRPDGTVRWLSGAGRVQLGEHGEPLRGVGTSLDVTERRALEEQYLQAQKMEAVGLLAGGVAHDFNNLLTEILGHCELLLADLDPDDTRQADIAEIQKAGARAAGLTRQLMAFSRKEIIEPTVLDLNGVVAGMRGMLGRLIGENVNVVLSLRPELARVKADHGQVEQILMNLAVNARDAMPRGGTLRIETANIDLDENDAKTTGSVKPGPYVALTVADTGTGMTPQVQARLFEPFFTTKGRDEGTGLGLATVDGIVRRSGGAIDVLSEVGRGTSFTVYFPKTSDEAMVVAAPPPVDHSPARAHTVLVVDDAAALCELTRRLLQRLGYTVLIAASGDEALRVFEQNAAIDVLLTDVVMPGTSGPELTKAAGQAAAGAEGDLHVRVHGSGDRPARRHRVGDCVPAQTVHLGNARGKNPRGDGSVMPWRLVAGNALAAALFAAPGMAAGGGATGTMEVAVKAALLFNFAKFAEWPALPSGAPIIACIVGDDPMATALADTVRAQQISGHPVEVRRSQDSGTWRVCQLLFIADAETRSIRQRSGRDQNAAGADGQRRQRLLRARRHHRALPGRRPGALRDQRGCSRTFGAAPQLPAPRAGESDTRWSNSIASAAGSAANRWPANSPPPR